jgi:protein-L-isoaspartate(D-aspartate) O-methyltransferase
MADAPDFADRRRAMVQHQLAGRDIVDPVVLAAMGTVPREEFVPSSARRGAYDDQPLSIGEGQTISQPYVVALMIQLAEPHADDHVLEIGTGSGYAAAVLSRAVAEVDTVERHPQLAADASDRLAALGYGNVRVHVADGSLGWAPSAPYDAIIVTAAGPQVPRSLVEQLTEGGRLVMPVGEVFGIQHLMLGRRRGGELHTEDLGPVAFVPLIGAEGWRRDYRTRRW